MMKKLSNNFGMLALIFMTIIIVLPQASMAQNSGLSAKQSTNDILNQIRQSQNVSRNSEILCAKVSNDQFEKLGDAIMSVMHPDEQQHELMDQMMGGEGSKTLAAMHNLIGQKYLNCGNYGISGGMMGGSGYSGQSMMGNSGLSGMMENWNWNNMMGAGLGVGGLFLVLGGIIMILFWAIVILAAIALLRWLINYLKGNDGAFGKAMDILKEKYAKGEITKNEFEAKKKDLM